MRDAFGEPAFVRNCVVVEAALARAQARLGIIPKRPPRRSRRRPTRSSRARAALDFARLKRETANVGFPILPLVRQLAERAGEAGRWLHWGATTQDIMDSAVVLQIRDGLALIEAELRRCAGTSPRSRGSIATRRCPAAPSSSRRCRSPSATRRRCGCRRSTAMPSASPN
jgi:3-carboxy-cis,cis-muconate cycloisomerase